MDRRMIILALCFLVLIAIGTCLTARNAHGYTPAKGMTVGVAFPIHLHSKAITPTTEAELGFLGDFGGWDGGFFLYGGYASELAIGSQYYSYGFGLRFRLFMDPSRTFAFAGDGRVAHEAQVPGADAGWAWKAGGGVCLDLKAAAIELLYNYGQSFDSEPIKDNTIRLVVERTF